MKKKLWGCLFIIVAITSYSQDTKFCLLKTDTDTSVYSFYYAFPNKNNLHVVLPTVKLQQYTLSRSIELKSIGIIIPVLIGKTLEGKKLIIIDENLNKDFSDDKITYFLDTLNGPNKGNYKRFKTYLTIGLNTKNEKRILVEFDYTIIKPPNLNLDLGDQFENNFHFAIRPMEYRKTIVVEKDTMYTIYLVTTKIFNFERGSSFLFVSSDTDAIRSFHLQPGKYSRFFKDDVVLIGNQKYIFKDVSSFGDSIFLKPLNSKAQIYGNKVGFYSPRYTATDILTKQRLSDETFRGRYLLLDYWGTWCRPCLQIMEDIKEMHNILHARKIEFVSICYDDNEKIASAFIKKNNMDWPQIFDSRDSSKITNLFDVKLFPSFILIDPEGKIVYRDEGINGFGRVQNFLYSTFNISASQKL